MGLKVGHATRSVDECIRQAKARHDDPHRDARSALPARRPQAVRRAVARFDKEVVQGTAAEFVAAKLAEREERHRRAGQSRYLVEPNVKDGKGGLRDLHTLFWIAKYVYRVREPEELIERGVFDSDEYCSCSGAARTSCGRCAATCTSSPAAPRSGCRSTSSARSRCGSATPSTRAMQDVERFMKHYFLIAKDVGDLTAILCAALEDRQAKPVPMLGRMMARFGRASAGARCRTSTTSSSTTTASTSPSRTSSSAIRSTSSASSISRRSTISPSIPTPCASSTRSLKLIDARAARERGGQPAVPRDPHLARRRRDGAAADERGRRARPLRAGLRPRRRDDAVQHVSPLHGRRAPDALHRRARRDRARQQRRIRARQRADARRSSREHRALLYVALFLHDIAKGRIEDHSIAGARIARRFVPAARLLAGRDRDRRLAGRASSRHVDGGAVARPVRPQDHREFRRRRAVARAAEASD